MPAKAVKAKKTAAAVFFVRLSKNDADGQLTEPRGSARGQDPPRVTINRRLKVAAGRRTHHLNPVQQREKPSDQSHQRAAEKHAAQQLQRRLIGRFGRLDLLLRTPNSESQITRSGCRRGSRCPASTSINFSHRLVKREKIMYNDRVNIIIEKLSWCARQFAGGS